MTAANNPDIPQFTGFILPVKRNSTSQLVCKCTSLTVWQSRPTECNFSLDILPRRIVAIHDAPAIRIRSILVGRHQMRKHQKGRGIVEKCWHRDWPNASKSRGVATRSERGPTRLARSVHKGRSLSNSGRWRKRPTPVRGLASHTNSPRRPGSAPGSSTPAFSSQLHVPRGRRLP